MGLEKVGLRAVFETAEFQRGQQIYQRGTQQANNAAKQVERQSKQSSQAIGASWQAGFAKVATAAALVVGAFKTVEAATRKVQEATKLAARVEMLGVAMESVGKIAGQSSEQMRAYEEAIKEQGITTQASRQILLQAAQAQIDFAATADIARVAQDAAVIANINSSEAAERLIYAIQSANVRVARTVGLNVSWQRSYEKLAAQLGKTTDDLTEQEKVQARVNEVMYVGQRISGTYEAALGTVGKQVTSLARHQEESMLILGNIFKESYGIIIKAQTEALKGFRKWAEENEAGLDELSKSFATLTEEALGVGKSLLALTDTDLTSFLDGLKKVTDKIGEALYYLKQLIAFAHAGVEMYREAGKTAVKGLREAITEGKELEEVWVDIATAGADKYEETLLKHYPPAAEKAVKKATEAAEAAEAAEAPEIPEYYAEAAEALTGHLDKVAKLHRDHYRKLAEMEADQNRRRAREQQQYYRAVAKEIAAGEKRIADITERYEKQRAEAIEDTEKRIAEAERDIYKDRERAQRDYERQQKQQRERYELDRLQSQRRYQYNYARLLAEGDALALYYLQQEHALEQQEAEENQALQEQQAQENYQAQIQDMEESAQELIQELQQGLQEQLAEQEQAYQEQIAKQKEANVERLAEMAANFEEQQALREEDNALALQQQEENYRRQLEDLGVSLADQEALRELGEEQTRRLLEQYWSESGENELVMEGWHDREDTRITVTEEMLLGLADTAAEVAASVEESVSRAASSTGWTGWTGVEEMDEGGVVVGPKTVRVGAGMVEMFMPLGRMSGSMNVGGNIGVNVAGLERASPALVNQIAAQVGARIFGDLTSELRTRRQAR